MLTQICGEAWITLKSYLDVEKIARQTGNLLTVDGSGDEEIKLQGIKDYSFGPEHALLPPQNVKGDNNEIELDEEEMTITEGGVVGEAEEMMEEEGLFRW